MIQLKKETLENLFIYNRMFSDKIDYYKETKQKLNNILFQYKLSKKIIDKNKVIVLESLKRI